MKFTQLISNIEQIQSSLQRESVRQTNQFLTIRNWLVGFHIVEFEQNGADRAQYGAKLLSTIAQELKERKLKGFSLTNLKLFRKFYSTYPQIGQPVADLLEGPIGQPLADQLKIPKADHENYRTTPHNLIKFFSFRHFTELIKIDDPIKRTFYEQQSIKGNWSARQLKRQIESLLVERVALSKEKQALIDAVHDEQKNVTIEDTIKDPYILEFIGFKELPVYYEKDLENAILNKIEEFLIELGNGFCFEARQKRITVGNEDDRIDLVFYHRILKCHVLIDLKTRAFSHSDVGQMNYYLNYYRKNYKEESDNPPVGIILCTNHESAKVEYAIEGLSNKLFVSKYLIELPKKEELIRLLEEARYS